MFEMIVSGAIATTALMFFMGVLHYFIMWQRYTEDFFNVCSKHHHTLATLIKDIARCDSYRQKCGKLFLFGVEQYRDGEWVTWKIKYEKRKTGFFRKKKVYTRGNNKIKSVACVGPSPAEFNIISASSKSQCILTYKIRKGMVWTRKIPFLAIR